MKALALYDRCPRGVRFHTRVRAAICPMERIVARVPTEGRVLEVGCGHGLFSNEVALGSPRVHVTGVDPSEEKVRWAVASSAGVPNVEFRVGRVDDVSERDFDVVAVLDVLYLVPRRDWVAFLVACRERIRPGGRFLLKEVDVRPPWKFYPCMLQELLSVRVVGITLGKELSYASRAEMLRALSAAGFSDVRVTDVSTGYLTPHVLYEARVE